MSYSATVISVMIASPGDVSEERNIIRDALHEWNDIHSRESGLVLLPVGWETHSSPAMGGRPQEIINERVLKHCDLLIGVFWTRIGTPTGVAPSGTVEEIQRHLDAGKPAMIYFSTAPVAPDSIDADQYSELKKFQLWCRENGLYENYDNISDFSEKFRRQIQISIRDNNYLSKLASAYEVPLDTGSFELGGVSEPSLSPEAERLLLEAAKDKNGSILSVRYLGGQSIQTNGINFVDTKDRRSIARWEAALVQLERLELIVARGHKGEIFEVTAAGYAVADELEKPKGS